MLLMPFPKSAAAKILTSGEVSSAGSSGSFRRTQAKAGPSRFDSSGGTLSSTPAEW